VRTRTRTILVASFLLGAMVLVVTALSTLSVTLLVKPDRESYRVGSSVHVELFLTYGPNFVRGPVTIPSISYEVIVSGAGGPVLGMLRYVETREPTTISPNTTQKIGEFDWDLKDISGNDVAPGTYRIMVRMLDYPLSAQTRIQVY